ncbi:MAG: hypothetical protein BJ554DRAFT_7456, partial [Olpidium bornovanus]
EARTTSASSGTPSEYRGSIGPLNAVATYGAHQLAVGALQAARYARGVAPRLRLRGDVAPGGAAEDDVSLPREQKNAGAEREVEARPFAKQGARPGTLAFTRSCGFGAACQATRTKSGDATRPAGSRGPPPPPQSGCCPARAHRVPMDAVDGLGGSLVRAVRWLTAGFRSWRNTPPAPADRRPDAHTNTSPQNTHLHYRRRRGAKRSPPTAAAAAAAAAAAPAVHGRREMLESTAPAPGANRAAACALAAVPPSPSSAVDSSTGAPPARQPAVSPAPPIVGPLARGAAGLVGPGGAVHGAGDPKPPRAAAAPPRSGRGSLPTAKRRRLGVTSAGAAMRDLEAGVDDPFPMAAPSGPPAPSPDDNTGHRGVALADPFVVAGDPPDFIDLTGDEEYARQLQAAWDEEGAEDNARRRQVEEDSELAKRLAAEFEREGVIVLGSPDAGVLEEDYRSSWVGSQSGLQRRRLQEEEDQRIARELDAALNGVHVSHQAANRTDAPVHGGPPPLVPTFAVPETLLPVFSLSAATDGHASATLPARLPSFDGSFGENRPVWSAYLPSFF